jgi:hypothetical protein
MENNTQMKPEIRKITVITEEIFNDGHRELEVPLHLSAAIAVVRNPYAGKHVSDLSDVAGDYSQGLGELLTERATRVLPNPPTVFGKATLVGEAGEVQHGSAIIHTKLLGDVMRDAANGGAVVPAAEKRGTVGSTLDVSLRRSTDAGDLPGTDVSHLYSWEVRVPDAPHADEILIIVAFGDGGRPNSRIRSAE